MIHQPNPKYPVPVRILEKLEINNLSRQIDIGKSARFMNDGRPVIVEYWRDTDAGLDCATAFYSVVDIKDWDGKQHREYLENNGIMRTDDEGPSTAIWIDAAGNSMWSVNWVENYDSN